MSCVCGCCDLSRLRFARLGRSNASARHDGLRVSLVSLDAGLVTRVGRDGGKFSPIWTPPAQPGWGDVRPCAKPVPIPAAIRAPKPGVSASAAAEAEARIRVPVLALCSMDEDGERTCIFLPY